MGESIQILVPIAISAKFYRTGMLIRRRNRKRGIVRGGSLALCYVRRIL